MNINSTILWVFIAGLLFTSEYAMADTYYINSRWGNDANTGKCSESPVH